MEKVVTFQLKESDGKRFFIGSVMMDSKEKIVEFWNYCQTCKHNKEGEDYTSPCDECLEHGGNWDSHKPVKYEPIDVRK